MEPPTQPPSFTPPPPATPANLPAPGGNTPAPQDQPRISFRATLWKFLAGLLLMAIIGLVAGTIFNDLAYQSKGKLSELTTLLSLMFYVGPMTIIFGIIAYTRRNAVWIAYPIMAYLLTAGLVKHELTKFLAGSLPILPSDQPGVLYERPVVAIGTMLAYMTVFAFVWPLTHLLSQSRSGKPNPALRPYGILLVISVVVYLGASYAAPYLYTTQQRTRAAVHLPFTDDMGSTTHLNSVKDQDVSLQSVDIMYQTPTEQRDGTYQQVDKLYVTPIKEWWVRGARDNCGNATYTNTPGGVAYREWTTDDETIETTPRPFQRHLYCFVLGYQEYTLNRSEQYGSKHLEQYPAPMVIDAIAKGKTYLPLCSSKDIGEGATAIPRFSYCTPNDKTKLAEHIDKSMARYTKRQPSLTDSSVKLQLPAAYQETGRMTIKEWGVSFPLSQEIKDAYYILDTPERVLIGLKSYDTCSDATRTPANGEVKGVAIMQKTSKSGWKQSSVPSVIVGDNAYGISLNSSTSCAPARIDRSSGSDYDLSDVFKWASKGITAAQ